MDIKLIPNGISCLADANIIIYHLANLSPECSGFLERVARTEITVYLTTTVIAEILHRRMLTDI